MVSWPVAVSRDGGYLLRSLGDWTVDLGATAVQDSCGQLGVLGCREGSHSVGPTWSVVAFVIRKWHFMIYSVGD